LFAWCFLLQEVVMNSIELESESAYCTEVVLRDADSARLLHQAQEKKPVFLWRTLLVAATIVTFFGTHINRWYRSAPSPGYLPNLHIDIISQEDRNG
jgi:hypothetical protein